MVDLSTGNRRGTMATIKELTRTAENHERLKIIVRNMITAIERNDERDIEKSAEEARMWFKSGEVSEKI